MAIGAESAALHDLVDALPRERLAEAREALARFSIPEDDEPVSDDERASLAATRKAYERDELLSHEAVLRELGL